MQKNTSLYLDLLRFAAAMVVFLGHAANHHISGGLLWQIYPYLQTAVIIFFVMSGYVIAYVVDSREHSWDSYLASRIARIYSVVLPALLVTLVCDSIGMLIDYESYATIKPTVDPNQIVNYSASVFLLQNVWSLGLNPGSNGPFWSLSYEVIYYVLFAVFYFLTGFKRYVSVFLLFALAGPSIISLFPIWVLGYCIYFLHKNNFRSINLLLSSIISIAAIVILIFWAPWCRKNLEVDIPYIRKEIVADYFDAMMFSLHLLFIQSTLKVINKIQAPVEKGIRWLASLTFVIYLVHYPILRVLSVLSPNETASFSRWLLIYPVTFGVIVLLTPRTEELKKYIQLKLFHVFNGKGLGSEIPQFK